MAKKPGRRTIVVIRPAKVDRLDDAPAGSPPSHQIDGCVVMPRTSFERERGWVVVEGRMIVAPYGADITADDLVDVDGRRWQVDGEPGDYENRRGKGKATLVYLKRQGS